MTDDVLPQIPKEKSVKSKLLLFFATLGIFLTTLFIYSPRYVYWTQLDNQDYNIAPEIARAKHVRRQLSNPLVRVDHPGHIVVQWRLLFPSIGFFLGLPDRLFFALPLLGCFLSIMFMLGVSFRELTRWRDSVMITGIMAGSSWFFVSSAWLGYFDSWYIFGLLLLSFIRSRWVIALTCLLVPLVNERFVMGLPVALLVRGLHLGYFSKEHIREFFVDCATAVLVLPFVVIRLSMPFSNDKMSSQIMQRFFGSEWFSTSSLELSGFWHGFRLAWIGLVLALFAAMEKSRYLGVLFLVAVLGTVVFGIRLTWDMSRTMAIVLPAVFYGWFFLAKKFSNRGTLVTLCLSSILLGNTILPARQVTTQFSYPIRWAPHEWDQFNNPPPFVTPKIAYNIGLEKIESGQWQDAQIVFSWVIGIVPTHRDAFFQRGFTWEKLKQPAKALEDYRRAFQLSKTRAQKLEARERMKQLEKKK